ncbi:putative cardiolipin synthase [Paracholeplasma brassicae]|uniref:Cardiolipin synthase n=1 Tax=Acholeplasma brassicae TaxID=61635 RepID=U4KNY7_9MOLU|nr:cardiolipin synthase [Paracholeplasma brassicae]CCV66006.1 putative cardiolipin synthase [Paracholeplasma brassicae]
MYKFIRFLTHKSTIIALLILLQLVFFGYVVFYVSKLSTILLYFFEAISYLIVIYVFVSSEPMHYKIAWIIPILIAPIFGGLFYVMFKPHKLSKKVMQDMTHYREIRKKTLTKSLGSAVFYDDQISKQVRHLGFDKWPLYEKTETTFFPSGQDKLDALLPLLESAKKFIFLEYFIIEPGIVWTQIHNVLKKKASEGIDVRIIYDDFGCSFKQPKSFKEQLIHDGIKVSVFNPMRPRLNLAMNYRDHRKIIVIDGNYGFTGGINLADEYMNLKEVYGHWQDAAIMLKGDAVWSLTLIFLENWDYNKHTQSDYPLYKPTINVKHDGYVIPFADSPLDDNFITKHAYLNLIMQSKKSIQITSPYFIIDNELMTALKVSAESGVRVDIIVPGIPDKRYVQVASEYYYKELLKTPNIYIHKYQKGFIHSKIVLIDDELAIVGTTNFDFRSLYLHFENNVWLYQVKAINDIKNYMKESIDSSHLITSEMLKKNGFLYRFYQSILVGFSHLM